jgi:hypothetical protein
VKALQNKQMQPTGAALARAVRMPLASERPGPPQHLTSGEA